jgi:hypothetical protein
MTVVSLLLVCCYEVSPWCLLGISFSYIFYSSSGRRLGFEAWEWDCPRGRLKGPTLPSLHSIATGARDRSAPYPATKGSSPQPSSPQSPEENETWKDGFAPDYSAKTHAQPPRLSPLVWTPTASHDGSLIDERATDEAGPADQRPWLDLFLGRVDFLRQTVVETDGQDRLKT